jgi:hypothetical protein
MAFASGKDAEYSLKILHTLPETLYHLCALREPTVQMLKTLANLFCRWGPAANLIVMVRDIEEDY